MLVPESVAIPAPVLLMLRDSDESLNSEMFELMFSCPVASVTLKSPLALRNKPSVPLPVLLFGPLKVKFPPTPVTLMSGLTPPLPLNCNEELLVDVD